jgi:hypothetical protein
LLVTLLITLGFAVTILVTALIAILVAGIAPALLAVLFATLVSDIVTIAATRIHFALTVLVVAIVAILIVIVGALFAVIAVVIVLPVATLAALLFETRPRFGDDAEIMIGKLVIIFGHHPVACHLRIARKRLIFLEHLRGIAARTIVDAIALFGTASAIPLLALSTPTATAAGLLTIIEQNLSLYSGC